MLLSRTFTSAAMATPLERFRAFNFDEDDAWRSYQTRVEVPPGMEERVKAKWFKREMEPDLDLNLVAPAKPAYPPQSAPAASPPAGAAPRRPPPPAVSPPPAAQQQPSLADVALIMAHVVFVVTTVLALQPIAPRLAHASFVQACRLSLGLHSVKLLRKFGAPKFSPFSALRRWFERVSSSIEGFYVLTAILASSSPWMYLALVSPAIHAALFALAALHGVLSSVPAWERTGGAAQRWAVAQREQAQHAMAVAEIGTAFQGALGVMRVGPRALMTTYVYANQLRGRFWNPETRAYHAQVWALLGQKAQPLLRLAPMLQRAAGAGTAWFQAARPQAAARP